MEQELKNRKSVTHQQKKRIEENFLCCVTFTVFSMSLIEIIILNLFLNRCESPECPWNSLNSSHPCFVFSRDFQNHFLTKTGFAFSANFSRISRRFLPNQLCSSPCFSFLHTNGKANFFCLDHLHD